MIEMNLQQLRAPIFSQAYMKLMNTTGLDPKAAYHIARLGKCLEDELKTAQESFDKLLKEWAEFKNENGQTFWKVPDDKIPAWTEANQKFHESTILINKWKMKLSDIQQAKLTPAEYLALEPVMTGFEVLEGGNHGDEKEGSQKDS